jgi:hypothetical protein
MNRKTKKDGLWYALQPTGRKLVKPREMTLLLKAIVAQAFSALYASAGLAAAKRLRRGARHARLRCRASGRCVRVATMCVRACVRACMRECVLVGSEVHLAGLACRDAVLRMSRSSCL